MAVRRQLAHSSVPARKADTAQTVVAKLAGKGHVHGCSACRRTILCRCDTPERNPTCRPCRGLELSAHDTYREPRECCFAGVVQVTAARDIEVYELAGPGPWFRCQTCFRHHACVPTRTP